jgi:hypothetical protein
MAYVDIEIRQLLGTRVCFARPARLQPGQRVRWINRTKGDAVVFFPHTTGLGPRIFCRTISPGKSYKHQAPARKTNPDQDEPESFHYAIYCHWRRGFAIGGSDPEIMVM